jgi:hypothetical protein
MQLEAQPLSVCLGNAFSISKFEYLRAETFIECDLLELVRCVARIEPDWIGLFCNPQDVSNTFLGNVGLSPNNSALQPRRPYYH